MQACGPQFSERKRIFIAPVSVNAGKLAAPLSQTKVIYAA